MMTIPSFLELPWAQALAWTLTHFVWQGALLGVMAFGLMRVWRDNASARYAVGVLTLAAMLVVPAVTFALQIQANSPAMRQTSSGVAPAPVEAASELSAAAVPASQPVVDAGMSSAFGTSVAAWVVVAWMVGVVALSVRLIGGWIVARRLSRRATRPVSPEIDALARRVAGRLALDRVVSVFESTAVAVPVLMGWLKPVVLLPASALSGLGSAQIEALLAHELAHVRRQDYLVNLLQSAVETLLFYHPAVWWVSRQVRAEREHCTDDLAVGVCDRLVYVTALTELASMHTAPRTALAATDGSLLGRVQRLLANSSGAQPPSTGWLAAFLVVLAAGVVATGAVGAPDAEPTPAVVESADQVSGGGVGQGVGQGVSSGAGQGAGTGTGVSSAVASAGAAGVGTGVALVGDAVAAVGEVSAQDRQRVSVRPVQSVREEQAAEEAVARQARERELAAMRKVLASQIAQMEAQADFQRAQREIDLQRLELELQRTHVTNRAHLVEAESQISSLATRIERVRREVEVGAVPPEELQQLEAQLAVSERQLEAARTNLELSAADLLLRRREIEQRTEHEQNLSRLERNRVMEELADLERALAERGAQSTRVVPVNVRVRGRGFTGSGNMSWTEDDDRAVLSWTGAFRVSPNGQDITFIEPGRVVRVSYGPWPSIVGIELRGQPDGTIVRTVRRAGRDEAWSADAGRALADLLAKLGVR